MTQDKMESEGNSPATRAELHAVRDATRADLHAVRDATRADLRAVHDTLTADINSLEVRLDARLDAHDKRFVRIEDNLHRLNAGFARMEGRMTDMEGKMDSLLTLKTDFAQFQMVLDRMARNQETFLRRWASHDDMLMDHERRIGQLESRPQ